MLVKWGDRMGTIMILSGPSGSGKSTVVREFTRTYPEFEVAKSVTTRNARGDGGDHYFFVDRQMFSEMERAGLFLETNCYSANGHWYGTPWSEVNRILDQGKIPILEIDPNGKKQAVQKLDQFGHRVRSIFLAAPVDVIYYRLTNRGKESQEEIIQRIRASVCEVEEAASYDALVINDDLEQTICRIQAVVNGAYTAEPLAVEDYIQQVNCLIERLEDG